jgi:hypothetical protein
MGRKRRPWADLSCQYQARYSSLRHRVTQTVSWAAPEGGRKSVFGRDGSPSRPGRSPRRGAPATSNALCHEVQKLICAPGRLLNRRQHTTKAHANVSGIGRRFMAEGGQQGGGIAEKPRSAAQDAICLTAIKPVLTPLPHIAAHVIKPVEVGRKTSDRRRFRETVIVTFDSIDSWPLSFGCLVRVIAGLGRGRPSAAPGIKVFDCPALFRRGASGLVAQPHRSAPFRIRGQAIHLVGPQYTFGALFAREPIAKYPCVFP